MFNWYELLQQVQQIVNTSIRLAKSRRREESTLGLAVIFFISGFYFTKWLPDNLLRFISKWHGDVIIPAVFYIIGLSFLGYTFYRIWKLVYIPTLPPPANRPSVIKGPLAFKPADVEIFRKLGREDELRKLLGYIQDDQVRLVVVMGASGVGKTSLLRAGLTDILKDTDIKYHYWEAVPSESGRGLLMAIQQSWETRQDNNGTAGTNPTAPELKSLDDLVNPAPELGRHVIVLDQFEQLGASSTGLVFRLLRKVMRESKPPHRITWVVAFRREYRANWSDFIIPEHERGFFPPELSLQLFTSEQARDVIGQLIQAAGISAEQKVINNLIEAATVEGEVSSVDIGIGLLVLSELYDRQGAKTLTQAEYHFAGGSEGLLTQYINRCLENFSDDDRKILLGAMLALRNTETNQRIAEGKTCDELAADIEAENIRRLNNQLERLTQRDIRLLEHVASSQGDIIRYRLPHERLIPALNRLAGKLIGELEEAKIKFVSAFAAWKNDKSSQYLLRGRTLRLVDHYKHKIPWGSDTAEKLDFLMRSKRRRNMRVGIQVGAAVVLLFYFGFIGWEIIGLNNWRNYYPAELADYQRNLKTLELTGYFLDLEDFDLLNSATLEEFHMNVYRSTKSVQGLAESLSKCPKMKKLALNFFYSTFTVKDLSSFPSSLTALSLSFNKSKVEELPLLPSTLTELTIDLDDSETKEIPPLPNTLTELTIKINRTVIKELPPLPNRLTKLTLSFRDSEVKELPPLPNSLNDLTLDLSGSKIKELPPLPNSLTALSLKLKHNQFEKLPLLPNNLTNLTLSTDDVAVSLPLPNKLTELNLDLSYRQMEKLPPWPKISLS